MSGAICAKCGARLSLDALGNSGCPVCESRASSEVNSETAYWPPKSRQSPHESNGSNRSSQRERPSNGTATSKKDDGPRELLLRFLCPSCAAALTVPLRSLGINEKCPGCREPLTVPTLDDDVVGFDLLRNSAGAHRPCARGPTKFADSETRTTAPESPTRPPVSPPLVDVKKNGGHAATSSEPSKSSSSPTRHSERDPSSPFFRVKLEEHRHTEDHVESADAPAPATRTGGARRVSSSTSLNPRHARYFVYYFIVLAPFLNVLLMPITHVIINAGISLLIAFIWLFIGRWIARVLTPLVLAAVFRSVRCPGCGESHPFVSQWNCTCGYHDHRQRHLLLFRCPKCSADHGYFDCPVCQATILL